MCEALETGSRLPISSHGNTLTPRGFKVSDAFGTQVFQTCATHAGRLKTYPTSLRGTANSADELLMPLRVEFGVRVVQLELDRLQAGLIGDLFSGAVGDVEGVEHLIERRGDLV